MKKWRKEQNTTINNHTLLGRNLKKSIEKIHVQLNYTQDLYIRYFSAGGQIESCLLYLEGMVDTNLVQRDVLDNLQKARNSSREQWLNQVIGVLDVRTANTLEEITEAILDGLLIILSEGYAEALLLIVRTPLGRAVEEPLTERTVRGPRDGFVENLQQNIGMLRRILHDPQLMVEKFVLGRRSRTPVLLIYIRDIADPQIVDEVRRRLQCIDTDSISATGYLEELIEDSHYCLVPQLLGTEKPDRVAAQLLEGRFAILTDGTPFALSGPVILSQFFQAAEDYYERWLAGSVVRILRFLAFLIATTLSASYIALTSFNMELIPFGMLAFIAETRRQVPLPPFAEALLMEFLIELLREAGLRIPQPIGQTMGVVGGIILGDALIRANLVSTIMVVVAVTSVIASFTVPNYTAALNLRLIRFPIIIMATLFGGLGIVCSWILIITNLARTSSFGVPLLSSFSHPGELSDMIVRLPWKFQIKRPDSIPHQDDIRIVNPRGRKHR